MDGPISLQLPPNPTFLQVFAVTGEEFPADKLEQCSAMLRDIGPECDKRAQEHQATCDEERKLVQTRALVATVREGLQAQLRKLWLPSWDEFWITSLPVTPWHFQNACGPWSTRSVL
jgi:hypothetical protein